MSEEKKPVQLAQSISATDEGLVTSKMLVEYLNSQQIQPFASGGMDLDLESINLRCNGRNVLRADSTGLVAIGSPAGHIEMKGANVYLNTGSDVSLYVGGRFVQHSEGEMQLSSPTLVTLHSGADVRVEGGRVDINGQSNLVIHGGPGNMIEASGGDMLITNRSSLYLHGPTSSIVLDHSGTKLNAPDTEVRISAKTFDMYTPNGSIWTNEGAMTMYSNKKLYFVSPKNSLIMDKDGVDLCFPDRNILKADTRNMITLGETGYYGKTSVQGHEVELKAYSGVINY